MSTFSRRKLITGGMAVTAGVAGLTAASNIARRYGIMPPDSGGLYGPGETLTYAAQRLLTRNSFAREFSSSQISKAPFANETGPLGQKFNQLEADRFSEWRLAVDGLVERPGSISLAQLKGFTSSSQITHLACEEGWSYIAEWIGVPLHYVLDVVGAKPEARYVVYRSFQRGWWESVDMADALHPQTLLTYSMNGSDLPVKFGGPLRLRVPRQLGYKSVKYIASLTLTDSLATFGKGLGSASPEAGYAWYAGI